MVSISLPPEGGLAPMGLIKPAWGMFVLLSGPGGVGKGTVGKQLLVTRDDLQLVPSATTRGSEDRDGEGEYIYCTMNEFAAHWKAGHLLEADQHLDNWYGQMAPEPGTIGLSDIDINGSERLWNAGLPNLLRIGLLPPGETLEEKIDVCVMRMTERGSSPDVIDKRRARAGVEIHAIQERWPHDPDALIIVNSDLDETVQLIDEHISQRLALID